MIGRDISFIVGQHHAHLDQAILHHQTRSGFVLEVAAIHESVGQEVIVLWFDRTGLLEKLQASGPVDLRVRSGLAVTEAGPIAFVLWWLPPVNAEGVPWCLREQILDPMHEGNREVLRRLGKQKYLHMALIGAGSLLLGLHEFKNEYGFFDLYSYAQAVSEKGWAGGYDFDTAHSAYERNFRVEALLHGRYRDQTLMAGEAPDY